MVRRCISVHFIFSQERNEAHSTDQIILNANWMGFSFFFYFEMMIRHFAQMNFHEKTNHCSRNWFDCSLIFPECTSIISLIHELFNPYTTGKDCEYYETNHHQHQHTLTAKSFCTQSNYWIFSTYFTKVLNFIIHWGWIRSHIHHYKFISIQFSK